ncbi:MAG: serine/threonine protein kinase, partial [Myxococcales bacterium]|nr:serine/threonine protein kinase [Myxococcales bacterium]
MNEQPASSGGRRFHLLEVIGEGAYGEVYLAEQDSGAGFRRKVAVKLLHANVARSRDAGQRMRDEARILGMLAHRNIVTVLDLVLLGDRWAVIMDHVPGADLEQILDAMKALEAKVPVAAALEVGAAVCSALACAHNASDRDGSPLGIVHRDIKPSNVRLTLDGEVKVLDFGVARVQLASREASTRGSAWLGTERYMSPERILCESDGPEGDVYAAAATTVELLLGRPLGRTPVLDERHRPFIAEAMEAVAERVGGQQGQEIAEILGRALDGEPDGRPDANDLSIELRRIARGLPGEDLVTFCTRFVPEVPGHLGLVRKAATGVLSEAHSGILSGPPADDSAPTLLPSDLPEPGPPPARGVGVLVAFGMFGLGGVMLALAIVAMLVVLVPTFMVDT